MLISLIFGFTIRRDGVPNKIAASEIIMSAFFFIIGTEEKTMNNYCEETYHFNFIDSICEIKY